MTGRRGEELRLGDMLRSVERLQELLSRGSDEFYGSWVSQSAAVRELEILGEAAGEISSSTRLKHPEIEWTRMRGFSSFAKHEYWRLNPKLVWRAIEEMPVLADRIKKAVSSL